MIQIEIMGPGCKRCDEAERLVKDMVNEYHIEAQVEKITDFQQMAARGVFSTPAVVINGKVMTVGRVPRKEELLDWLGVD